MGNIKKNIKKSIKDLIENNLTYLDYNDRVLKPIILTTSQNDVLRVIEDNNNVIIKKHRTVGLTTLINAIIACRLISNDKWNITYVNINYDCMGHNLKKIINYINVLVKKYDIDIEIKFKNNEIKFSNGNSLIMINKESDIYNHDICYTNWTIFDEAALNKNAIEVYNMIYRYYDIEKTTIISTQNGLDEFFFPIYFLGPKAGFKTINARWQTTEFIETNNIARYKKSIGNIVFEREFGDKFMIHNPDKIDSTKLIDNIKKYLVFNEIFSLSDLNKLTEILKEE